MDADLYRQQFAELIVHERDVTGQLPAEFAAAYARRVETVNRRHWVAALASYSDSDVRHWLRAALLNRLCEKASHAALS